MDIFYRDKDKKITKKIICYFRFGFRIGEQSGENKPDCNYYKMHGECDVWD